MGYHFGKTSPYVKKCTQNNQKYPLFLPVIDRGLFFKAYHNIEENIHQLIFIKKNIGSISKFSRSKYLEIAS